MNENLTHAFDLSLEINLGVPIKSKIHISHQRMLQDVAEVR